MFKNKGTIYLIIISLIVLVGVVLLASKKDSNAKVGISDPGSLSTENGSLFKQMVGKQAPDFSLESIDGGTVKLSDYRGKTVVLFFSGGSMCYPACWNQIEELANDEKFNTDDTTVFSLVVNPKSEWKRIVKETPAFSNAKILFDTTKTVSRSYNVLYLKSSMHQGIYPGHTYFIIDKEGIVRYTFDDPSMAIRNDMIFSELSKISGE